MWAYVVQEGLYGFACCEGWEKSSFGYHGDDGNSFCSSGSGQPYGSTFTTGDVIGCCVNLVDMTCFYTKNGINLGWLHFMCCFVVQVPETRKLLHYLPLFQDSLGKPLSGR